MSKGPEKYYTVPVIPVDDDLLHTTDKPFCYDGTCGCHEDPLLISEVAHYRTSPPVWPGCPWKA